jgi:hypothetical protein
MSSARSRLSNGRKDHGLFPAECTLWLVLAMLPSTRMLLCATPAALQHLAPRATRSCHNHVRLLW